MRKTTRPVSLPEMVFERGDRGIIAVKQITVYYGVKQINPWSTMGYFKSG